MNKVTMAQREAAGKELAALFARPTAREIGKRAPKRKALLTAEDRGFYRGVAVAINILSVWDEPTIAKEIVTACGKLKDFKDAGVEEYDLKHVRAAFKGETWRPASPDTGA
ncbi:MAG: hypothetical protein ACRDL7_12885 [Gaiellaceae bacterium]